jgi:hypothetical protein
VNVGDAVDITYTEALALKVDKKVTKLFHSINMQKKAPLHGGATIKKSLIKY